MKFGQVKGNVVATTKNQGLVGMKLLIIQPTDEFFKPIGETLVGIDSVGAGSGDHILYSTGSAARGVIEDQRIPVDVSIVAIIDSVEVC